jgi:UDP-glucose:(heptosyl)LPS alpha-1,3-glucosyltransferase
VRFYGRNPETIALIPNGVRTDFFRPPSRDEKLACREKLHLPNQVPVVAFVGSGFRRKGLFQLLNSMRICSDFSLIVAGRDKEFNNVQSFINRYRLTDRVRLLGPTSDVRNVYWASDIFVLPSLYDPSSNAILEALSCGLPCITTANVGSMTEILEVNAGARCERNPEDLAVKILKLISSETDINSLSINARRLAQRWDEKIVLEQWLKVYQDYR